ncbi:alpha/beta hydrolase [Nonomuraea sp. NPDC003560]|uniref:alpha/beta hydrolase n=1 Tax=Nonomuraea sp. NPDC003560 TaxID=3364341 RepID=UPI003687EC9B
MIPVVAAVTVLVPAAGGGVGQAMRLVASPTPWPERDVTELAEPRPEAAWPEKPRQDTAGSAGVDVGATRSAGSEFGAAGSAASELGTAGSAASDLGAAGSAGQGLGASELGAAGLEERGVAGAVRPAPGRERLVWSECGGGLRCATLPVPADWAKPREARVAVRLAMMPAQDPLRRLGALVVNTGAASVVREVVARPDTVGELARWFDVVLVEARGAGDGGHAGACPRPRPDPARLQVAEGRTVWRAFARDNAVHDRACRAALGPAYAGLTSWQVAHDLDAVRAALGESRLRYLGNGYGSVYGQAYLELFPGRAGRMYLEGLPDHTETGLERRLLAHARAQERQLGYFRDWCRNRPGCPLGRADAVRVFDGLVRRAPLRLGGGERTVSGHEIAAAVWAGLTPARWPALAQALSRARTGDATGLAALLPAEPPQPTPPAPKASAGTAGARLGAGQTPPGTAGAIPGTGQAAPAGTAGTPLGAGQTPPAPVGTRPSEALPGRSGATPQGPAGATSRRGAAVPGAAVPDTAVPDTAVPGEAAPGAAAPGAASGVAGGGVASDARAASGTAGAVSRPGEAAPGVVGGVASEVGEVGPASAEGVRWCHDFGLAAPGYRRFLQMEARLRKAAPRVGWLSGRAEVARCLGAARSPGWAPHPLPAGLKVPPVLVGVGRLDNETPSSGAARAAGQIPGARVLWHGDGQGAYLAQGVSRLRAACLRTKVHDYLVNGVLPKQSTFCPGELTAGNAP